MAAQKPTLRLQPKQAVVATGRVAKLPPATVANKKKRKVAKRNIAPIGPMAAAAATANNNQNSPLLRLPAELRNKIYFLALTRPSSRKRIDIGKKKVWEPGFLRACKQLRNEASSIFYTSNDIYAEVRHLDFRPIVHHLRYMHKLGLQAIGPIHIDVIGQYRQRWTLKPMLPLVHFLAQTGVELQPHEGGRVFWPHQTTAHCFEAQKMGLKAYAEGWSAEWLEDEFVQWAETREARPEVWRGPTPSGAAISGA